MINVNKLKGKIVEKGLSIEKVAAEIGVSTSTFYRKLSDNGENFSIKEVDTIVKILKLSSEDATIIFFAQFVA